MTEIESRITETRKKLISAKQNYQNQHLQKETYYDFCRYYQLAEVIKNNLFINRFNSPELSWVFLSDFENGTKTPPVTFDFLDAIDTRIKDGSHITVFIWGPTNSGKSEMAQSIAKYYQSKFKKLRDIVPPIPLVFNDVEFNNYIPKMGIGDIPIRDESSEATGEGSRNLKTHVHNIIRVVRAHQNSFIFVNPDLLKVPLIDYFIEMAGKLKLISLITKKEYIVKFTNKFLPKEVSSKIDDIKQIEVFDDGLIYINQENRPVDQIPYEKDELRAYLEEKAPYLRRENNPYNKYKGINKNVVERKKSRMILYTKIIDETTKSTLLQPIGRMYLPLHNDEDFRKKYQKAKDKNIWELKAKLGQVSAQADESMFYRDVYKLYEYLQQFPIESKVDIKTMLYEYNAQFDKAKDKIQGPHVDDVINRVSLALKGTVPLKRKEPKPDLSQQDRIDTEEFPEEELQELIEQEEYELLLDNINSIDFSGFDPGEKALEKVRKTSKMQKIDRNIMWYQMSKEYTQEEIASSANTSQPNVNRVLRSISGDIWYYEGKMFEKFVRDKLRRTNLFEKVKLMGGSGDADILAYAKDKKTLFIYSIKNISIDPDAPYVDKNELDPEIKFAQKFGSDYHTILKPLIRDKITNKIYQPQFDYNTPHNIKLPIHK